jgi:NAD(P)-dependent dehydrogenase (short-subunit alcohol dehydrogenase family)
MIQAHRFELEGATALVTGAAQGIGYAIAHRLGRLGATVCVADRENASAAVTRLERDGITALALSGDVSKETDVGAWVDEVADRFGALDVLVNNAGIYTSLPKAPFETETLDEWRRVLDVNVVGTFIACREAARVMRPRGRGRIVNITSATVFKGTPLLLHYVASKGAVTAMTRVLATELGPYGITVNAVAPGLTISDGLIAADAGLGARTETARGQRSLPVDVLPEDIAATVAHLAGAGAAVITGQTFVVDAGSVYK